MAVFWNTSRKWFLRILLDYFRELMVLLLVLILKSEVNIAGDLMTKFCFSFQIFSCFVVLNLSRNNNENWRFFVDFYEIFSYQVLEKFPEDAL